jgi:hypothetical protein
MRPHDRTGARIRQLDGYPHLIACPKQRATQDQIDLCRLRNSPQVGRMIRKPRRHEARSDDDRIQIGERCGEGIGQAEREKRRLLVRLQHAQRQDDEAMLRALGAGRGRGDRLNCGGEPVPYAGHRLNM